VSIELEAGVREEIAQKLQAYFLDNLDRELGGFEAQFLLDFFTEQIGCFYYNQGLADALSAMEQKTQEITDLIYELEKFPSKT
jgi:uncharacterized protein (DUF2164 family)